MLKKVLSLLENSDIRTLIDNRAETMGKKIREAETQKIPYMLIVGENEEKKAPYQCANAAAKI